MAPAIGIDLGTTYSCAAVYRNGKPEIIPNKLGQRLTPSYVYYDPLHIDQVFIGYEAMRLMPQCPGNAIYETKRLIGRKYDDQLVNSRNYQFALKRGDDDDVEIEIECCGEKIRKKPQDVSAEVLKYLKESATIFLGEKIIEAVISVPAYFSNSQRKATKEAAKLAGIKLLKLVTEPTAGAIYYVSDKEIEDENILVFDLGGGTLDVSIIKVNDKKFEVKNIYGDCLLGGLDFTENLYEYFCKHLTIKYGTRLTRRGFFRLVQKCDNLKVMLSYNDSCTIAIENFVGENTESISMSKKHFEDLNKALFERAIEVVKFCLHDSLLEKSAIDEIVLVGGSTRIPKMQKILSDFFDGKELKTVLNPDEAVAAGACMQAALLKENLLDLEKFTIQDITPLSLGLKGDGNLMTFIIRRNSQIPATQSHRFTTSYNNQTKVRFQIYEGERKNCNYNNKLGEVGISGLPRKRAGDVKFTVTYSLDEDGLLEVTASETSTGKTNKLVITISKFHLSENKIRNTLDHAKLCEEEDNMFQEFVVYKNKVKRFCNHILYDIDKVKSQVVKEFLRKKCEDFIINLEQFNFNEIEKLKTEFKAMANTIKPILDNYNLSFSSDFN